MVRKLTILLAFLAVIGQSLAGTRFPSAASEDFGHIVAHAQEGAHHHHDDAGMHVDGVDEESFHVHVDGANLIGLPGSHASRPGLALPQGPPIAQMCALPSPTINGLLRPPKHAS
jgi:hypothetical protein